VIDSLGHEAQELPGASGALVAATEATLRAGDRVHFTCRATDPQGREIRWWIETKTMGRYHAADGPDVTIEWPVQDVDVGVNTEVTIRMASESAHHRHGFAGDDGLVIFRYTVLPAEPRPVLDEDH
jgi:hypothetical protein